MQRNLGHSPLGASTSLLAPRQTRGRRRPELSQHFIHDPRVAVELVRRARVEAEDLVVEIGSGRGELTAALAAKCRLVIAVEVDPYLCGHLRRRFAAHDNVVVVEGDYLRHTPPKGRHRVVGNIPFAKTAAIVRSITEAPGQLTDASLVVQEEAANRFTGSPVAPESLTSLLIKPWWHIEVVHRLKPADFRPRPRVGGAQMAMARRVRPLVSNSEAEGYKEFIRDSFGRTGRTAWRCLRPAPQRPTDRGDSAVISGSTPRRRLRS